MDDGWMETTTKIETIDSHGDPVILQGVKAYQSPKTKKIYVFPVDVMRAEMEALAESLGLQHRDLALFTMMYAKPGPFQEGYVHMLYRMNKMLFYQSKALEKRGFNGAFPHDQFEAQERGPVPVHLKADLRRLERMGFMNVEWPSGPQRKPISLTLTPRGEFVASVLWEKVDPLVKEETLRWKKRLFLKSPTEIKERVHKDYPEFRKTFTDLDTD